MALGHPIGARSIPVGGGIQRGQLPQFAIVAQAALRPVLCGSLGLHLPVSATGGGRFRPPWPEESKETGGFVAGNPTGTASPWHTTLLARSSVLYLHPRLTGKRSVSTKERSFCSAGKRAGFCEWERAKTGPVSGVGAGI